ncbi:hypothetical protein [Meridianimarinicoccus aquatilis]|uniref:Uncharacterized protein n=1 Tax=Meridianimarinicoccus aquatilis TaxID=2552766 RepID=A0A4R6AMX2_9RHOB|nr:hypothetical protein [Fluviibacterium aquatile]TDL83898.1 hypothetical protein E2L05_18690 [Fluviibacterium aquatile]
MKADIANLIHPATGTLNAAQAGLKQAQADILKAHAALIQLQEIAQSELIDSLPISEKPISEHRRLHKSGRAAKLDTDPELRSFVLARIDRLTYEELEAEIAGLFPVERRLKKSSIHSWWQRNRRHFDPSGVWPHRRTGRNSRRTSLHFRYKTR